MFSVINGRRFSFGWFKSYLSIKFPSYSKGNRFLFSDKQSIIQLVAEQQRPLHSHGVFRISSLPARVCVRIFIHAMEKCGWTLLWVMEMTRWNWDGRKVFAIKGKESAHKWLIRTLYTSMVLKRWSRLRFKSPCTWYDIKAWTQRNRMAARPMDGDGRMGAKSFQKSNITYTSLATRGNQSFIRIWWMKGTNDNNSLRCHSNEQSIVISLSTAYRHWANQLTDHFHCHFRSNSTEMHFFLASSKGPICAHTLCKWSSVETAGHCAMFISQAFEMCTNKTPFIHLSSLDTPVHSFGSFAVRTVRRNHWFKQPKMGIAGKVGVGLLVGWCGRTASANPIQTPQTYSNKCMRFQR